MSDDDLQIFPSLAPDAPQPDFPTGHMEPASQSSSEETDDILLEGLVGAERDRVVAAWARLEEVETSYPGTLAICMTSAARAHARFTKAAIKALGEAPDKIKKASDTVNLAAENNDRLIQQVATVAVELKESAKTQQESQKYTEKFCRWNFALILGGLILFILCLGVLGGTWVASEKAAGLTEAAKSFEQSTEQIRKLQFVTNSRLLLQADENQLQSDWRQLQLDVAKNNNVRTEEHQQRLERLKTWKSEIDARWVEQNEKEKQVFKK